MNPVLYTGDGNTSNAITGVGFQPDLVWLKDRDQASNHQLQDAVRGKSGSNYYSIHSDSTAAQSVQGDDDGLNTLGADGFTVGYTNSTAWNESGTDYVSWNWKANGAGVLNEVGTLDSTVSVNTTAGFSVVKFTASGSGDETVGHGLGVKPKMVITKVTSTSGPWNTYNESLHSSAPEDWYVALNSTAATASAGGVFGAGMTSSVIGIGVGVGFTAGQDYIAYCFADVKGFCKSGTYKGNGNADGSFIYTGFQPSFVLWKKSSDTGNWLMMDNKRSTYNFAQTYLKANASAAEDVTSSDIRWDFLSNGLKCRGDNSAINTSGGKYLYLAFAAEPLVANVGTSLPATAR